MAKQPLKRPAAKKAAPAVSKKPPTAKARGISKKPVSAAKAAVSKSVKARPLAAKLAAKPPEKVINGKATPVRGAATKIASAKLVSSARVAPAKLNGSKVISKPAVNGRPPTPANGATMAGAKAPEGKLNGKSGGKANSESIGKANGQPVAAKTSAKPMNGAKPSTTPVIAEAPKTPGRPMLMQGPVASKSLTKKGTFVLTKPPLVAPKPVKRKLDRPEPAFVTLQPPVAQVRTSEKAVKNRAGLNQRDLDFFRDLLLAKRRELVGDMSHMEREALRESNAHLASLPTHSEEQGTDAYEQEFTLGLVEKDRTLLREINDAMAKLQNGTYGICEGTGNPISRPRLEAQPWARHSIEFARILEKRQMVFRR